MGVCKGGDVHISRKWQGHNSLPALNPHLLSQEMFKMRFVCRDSQTMVLRSSSCVGLGSLQLFFRLGFEFTWNTAHLHAVRQKVTFLSVANRNFAEEKKKKKLVLLFINCSQIWYLLKSCLYKKCIKVHWQNQRKKLRVPFNLLASRMWDRQVASSLFPEVTWS